MDCQSDSSIMIDDGPVKIVGLHHNFCLATELYSEGWIREQFADVLFYCQPSKNNSSSTLKRNLRANRSVLAASSPFFASLLPEGELENEICISTGLLYSDLFCILEYIYSGKLLCSLQKKDEILSLLREYQVFVPDELDCTELVDDDQINADEGMHFSVEQVAGLEEDEISLPSNQIMQGHTRNTTLIQTFVVDEEDAHLKEVSELVFLPQQQQTFGHGNSSNHVFPVNHRSRTKKSGSRNRQSLFQSERGSSFSKLDEMEDIASTDLRSISPSAFITKIPQKEFARNLQPSQERFNVLDINITDYLMSKTPLNKNAVTLQIENDTFSASSSPDHQGHGSSTSYQKQQSPNALPDTWCDGVFSPFEPSTKKLALEKSLLKAHPCAISYQNRRKQQPVFNIGTSLDPVLLSSKPQRVYSRKESNNSADGKRIYLEKPQINLTEVQKMITHKGKVHITVADKSKSSTSPLLNLSEEESSNQDLQTNSDLDIEYDFESLPDDFDTETEEDKNDLNLARQYLEEELNLKKKNQLKLQKHSSSLTQHMKIARKILKRQSNMDKKMLQREVIKFLQPVRKSGPQVQCEQCGKLVLASGLKHHLAIHSGVKSHLCELCGRAFLLKSYLNAHIRVNHRGIERPKRYMCSHCGHACYTKDKLEVHERVHTDERPFECQYCDKRFREKGTLVRHIRTHTGERPYACDICNTSYGARATYVEHYKRVHGPKPEGAAERQSKNRYNNVVVYRCDFCHKGFRRILAYEKHRATHTGITAAVRCSQDGCQFTYSEMSQLRDHMAESHPTKTYSCSICLKIFLSKQNLIYHQSKHDSNLGFHCSYCTVSLTTKASLIAHEKIHTRETPYECPHCDERFHSPYLLKIHLRKHEPRQTTKRSRPMKRVLMLNLTADL